MARGDGHEQVHYIHEGITTDAGLNSQKIVQTQPLTLKFLWAHGFLKRGNKSIKSFLTSQKLKLTELVILNTELKNRFKLLQKKLSTRIKRSKNML